MAETATIYRVQDVHGRGPWKPGFSDNWVEWREDCKNLLPWMVEFGRVDSRAISGMAIGCGCRTLEQLRRWFTRSEYRTLQGFGYRAVQMEVGRILAESETQCVFERLFPLRLNVQEVCLYPLPSPQPEGQR